MTLEIALLILIILLAVVFFCLEWVAADVIALAVLLSLILIPGLLPADQAFAGFGSDTVILILGLLIMTAALLRTGLMDLVARGIIRYTGDHPTRLLLVIMVAAAGLSAFISNTAATAFFVPIVMGLATRAKVSPSKFLLPLAFSSILTSSVTLISTSTNIVISGLMPRFGLEPMGMFELAPVGIPIAIVGLTYMALIGRKMIPNRANPEELLEDFGVRPYLSEIIILPTSYLVGKTLAESALGRDLDLTVLRLVREKNQHLVPGANTVLQAGDILLVEGKSDEILKIKDTAGIEIKADIKATDPNLQSKDVGLVEAILLPKSPLIGRTLKGLRFRERYGLQVLGINRHGENIRRKLSEAPLRMGDVLLLQGPKANIAALESDNTFRILGKVVENRPNRRRARIALAIFVGSLALGTTQLVPFAVAMLLGVIGVFLTRCITPEEAYREVEWKAIILIGSMLGLGAAMEHTGTAKYLAGVIVDTVGRADPFWLLTGFFFLTVLLTQPMSNQAAAVVVLPVAIETAFQLDLNARTFAMTVAVAASCSYLTPLEPSCVLVYGLGRYRFTDFLKVGSVLTILIYGLAMYLVPKIWPMKI
jgi:di/tricarboxylate transporter